MMSEETFIKQSLEHNLFYLRVLKEHALFLAAALPAKNEDLIKEAKQYNKVFNDLLTKAVELSRGVVNIDDDAVTSYTLKAEEATSFLTGVAIDTNLTNTELELKKNPITRQKDSTLVESVKNLNGRAIVATRNIIRYKTKLLEGVLSCKLYTSVYPLLIEHIRREAIMFVDLLTKLQNSEESKNLTEVIKQEVFWNQIMAEHSEFIRGFLDPTEKDLIKIANDFSIKFYDLNKKALSNAMNLTSQKQITNESLVLTKEIKNFKTQGTEGLLKCSIRSLIFPLLGDHVIRESNHYLKLLQKFK